MSTARPRSVFECKGEWTDQTLELRISNLGFQPVQKMPHFYTEPATGVKVDEHSLESPLNLARNLPRTS